MTFLWRQKTLLSDAWWITSLHIFKMPLDEVALPLATCHIELYPAVTSPPEMW